ncbi:hypothetical protein Tsubulata_020592 [Turnera subulata]|uniref:DNA replication complex GINS protein PSF2 N-terminal domain-containing protein n=1 Tax=Turnera subulata TaxID=218843 RepID=A0A9Q0JKA6_9ROSI|nr:hypothetical protein Tsubulata_020592 [Turnera subulata]
MYSLNLKQQNSPMNTIEICRHRRPPTFSLFLAPAAGGSSQPHHSPLCLSDFVAQVEFMAEDETVGIVPNLHMEALNFISGDYGPFYPQIITEVPLWLAVALRKRGKCTVRSLIEDIRDVRFHKVQTNLEKFTASAVTWKNMSAMEVNIIRAFSGRALQAFYKHEQLTPDSDRAPDTQPQIPSNRPRRNLRPR